MLNTEETLSQLFRGRDSWPSQNDLDSHGICSYWSDLAGHGIYSSTPCHWPGCYRLGDRLEDIDCTHVRKAVCAQHPLRHQLITLTFRYQSELCDRKTRGRLVSAEVLFVGVGIVTAYWFDFGLSFIGGAVAWRLPIAFQMVFALMVIVLVFALPESPRWLFNHQKEEEAVAVLCAVYDKEPTDPYVLEEKAAITQAIELELSANTSKSFLSIFRNDSVKTRYRVLLAWGMQFMNQAGGINLVVYYISSVLVQNVGLSSRIAQILGGCINMMFMFGSILPSFALDRMGRRNTMMAGCFGLGVCMLFISALLSQSADPNGKTCASAAVAFFFLYMLIFGMSVNCVPWVYVPEVLPLEARTKGTAVGISSNWLWNFIVVMITPVIINRLQWKAYLIFMCTNLLFVPLVYFFYPETSNLRLEDIDFIFSKGGNPVAVARDMATDMKLNGNCQHGRSGPHNEPVLSDSKDGEIRVENVA